MKNYITENADTKGLMYRNRDFHVSMILRFCYNFRDSTVYICPKGEISVRVQISPIPVYCIPQLKPLMTDLSPEFIPTPKIKEKKKKKIVTMDLSLKKYSSRN